MAYTLVGNIFRIGKIVEKQYKDKTYYTRALVLEQVKFDQYTGNKLPSNFPQVEFNGSGCDKLDSFDLGDLVDVEFVIDGFEYRKDDENRNFTKIKAISVKLHDTAVGNPKPKAKGVVEPDYEVTPPPLRATVNVESATDMNDLPF